jgi:hypothetical protein
MPLNKRGLRSSLSEMRILRSLHCTLARKLSPSRRSCFVAPIMPPADLGVMQILARVSVEDLFSVAFEPVVASVLLVRAFQQVCGVMPIWRRDSVCSCKLSI